MIVRNLKRLLMLLALLPGLAVGQEILPSLRVAREEQAPGLAETRAERNVAGGRAQAALFEVNLNVDQVKLGAEVFSASGAALGMALKDPESFAALAMAVKPGANAARMLGGLNFTGTLWSWPARGVQLVVASDETPSLVSFGGGEPAVAICDDGSSFTLTSLNGGPSDGGPVLFSDGFSSQRNRGWTSGTLALTLTPPAAGNRALWDDSLSENERWWRVGALKGVEELTPRGGDYLLVIPATDEMSEAPLVDCQRLRFEFPLPWEVRHSLLTLEVGEWFLRDGELVSTEGQGSFVGVDSAGRRAWFVQNGALDPGTVAFSAEEARAIFQKEGIRDMARLSFGESRLLVKPRNDFRVTLRGPQTVLAMFAARGEMRLGGRAGSWERLQLAWATGSNADEAVHRPEALIDNRVAGESTLESFWAADSATGMPWVEIGLARPSVVHALDVIHAEAAGFSREFNMAGFRVLGRESNDRPWVELDVVSNAQPVSINRININYRGKLSLLRIEVTKPNFLHDSGKARLAEIIAWGEGETE